MTASTPSNGNQVVLKPENLQAIIETLQRQGHTIIGPTIRSGAITYEEISSSEELPAGWRDEQEAGTYRLKKKGGKELFGYVVGPQSWKRFLFPPLERLWRAEKSNGSFEIQTGNTPQPRYVFLGARPCELAAMQIQDRVFASDEYADQGYQSRRSAAFIIAVNCSRPADTCFCSSMNTGPRAESGFDICLTEVLKGDSHFFLATSGSGRGAEVLSKVPSETPNAADLEAAEKVSKDALKRMKRKMDLSGIQDLFSRNFEHPRWEETARRCLACTNCTQVCPTCFCHSVEDVTDLAGKTAERWRRWDSCFNLDFSYIHGGSIRSSGKARYRQWLSHKLAHWIDQFGLTGCVGCGRCITWCPVGIDLTEEVRVIRESDSGRAMPDLKEEKPS